jgi:predicted phage terminase large subunit-like protein
MLWRVIENRCYLEYVWRRKVEFPELQASIIELARSYRPDTILIEDKGAGTGLIQALKDHAEGFPVRAYDPGRLDKETRMRVQSVKIENGLVFLPPEAPWLGEFLNEVRRFPTGAHDDQIDAMSQLLDHAGRSNGKLIHYTYRT